MALCRCSASDLSRSLQTKGKFRSQTTESWFLRAPLIISLRMRSKSAAVTQQRPWRTLEGGRERSRRWALCSGSGELVAAELSTVAGTDESVSKIPSGEAIDQGFRAVVQELSKRPVDNANGAAASDPSPNGAGSFSATSSSSSSETEDDASASSRTFTGERDSPSVVKVDRVLDGLDEARRHSSRGASSSTERDPPERSPGRWGGGFRRQRRTVVDRWVAEPDDEEDYLSRRPARYEKWDRSLASEYSNGGGVRNGRWERAGREGTGGDGSDGQVATLQRYVPVELLAVARKRRVLKKAKEGGTEASQTSDGFSGAEVSTSVSVVGHEQEVGEKEQAGEVLLLNSPNGIHLKGGTEGAVVARVSKTKWRGRRLEKELENRRQRALTRRVTELAKRRQLDQVFEAVESARQRGVTPDRKALNAVVAACARCADPDRAREVFNEMVAEGGPGVNEVTYGALLKALGAAGRVDEALRLLDLMGTPTAPGTPQVTNVHVATVLNACADVGDSVRARQVLETRGERSTLAYNMLIKAHAKSATPLGALLIVDEMRAHGLALDRGTYNSLILACVNGDNMPRAWELFKEMKSRVKFLENLQLAPDAVTYTTLLRGVARPGALATVLRLAEEMHMSASGPAMSAPGPATSVPAPATSAAPRAFDRVAYGALIDACIKCGSPDTAESVLAEMEERGREDPKLRPGPYAFLALMRAFAAEGELERCEELREGMCSGRCSGWATVAERQEADELCLEAAVVSGYTGPAKRLLRTMKAVKEGRPLSQRATAALVRLYAADGFPFRDSLRIQPLKFRKDASPAAHVVTRSLPVIPELMFVGEDKNPEEVALLLEETPVVLVVRQGAEEGGTQFLGYLTKAELRGGVGLLTELMRPLPPPIATNDPISHAATLLLQNSSEVLLVVEPESGKLQEGQENGARRSPSNADAEQGEVHNGKALATVVGIVTRGQLFEGLPEAGAFSGYPSDDESGLEMIKQDLSKRGTLTAPRNPEDVPQNADEGQGVRAFPWRTRLAQLFGKGDTDGMGGNERRVFVGEETVEDDLGLEMIRQDMMKLDAPVGKKVNLKKEQKSRQALARLAYLEGLDLDDIDLVDE